jgi:hypothetical protein
VHWGCIAATIEMYKNNERKSELLSYGEKFRNPFSTGSYRGNFEQVLLAKRFQQRFLFEMFFSD